MFVAWAKLDCEAIWHERVCGKIVWLNWDQFEGFGKSPRNVERLRFEQNVALLAKISFDWAFELIWAWIKHITHFKLD